MSLLRALAGALIVVSFGAVAVVQSWPLPLHLSNRLTGNPGGDTGVYVWNLWVFRHEWLQGKTPLTTDRILAPTGPADLSLHNYTIASDLLALPLLSFLDIVSAFNLIYLINIALVGVGGYALARQLRATDPVARGPAWVAGLLFACSPFLLARSTAHFSLVAAAPLPFFVFFLDRAWHRGTLVDAACMGATVAWAAYSDPYYAIYCVLLGIAFILGHTLTFTFARRSPDFGRATRAVDLFLGVFLSAIIAIAALPGRSWTLGPVVVSMHSLYTPVLIVTVLLVARAWLTHRVRMVPTGALPRRWWALSVTACVSAALCLGPLLAALITRVVEERWTGAPVLWRSSAPGVDIVSFLLPNPTHALAPEFLTRWFASEPGRFEENVVSIPWTALAIIGVARIVTGRWGSRLWMSIALGFALLALGPFVRVAGIDTYVPTPWALIRYVPLIGEARVPSRFGVVVILAVAMLFAEALDRLARHYPQRRRAIVGVTAVVLALELWPAPRTLYRAELPSVYQPVVADARPVSILQLPFGVRDGLSSAGDFSALSQFYQTFHGKQLIGGYLSRVSDRRKEALLNDPFITALVEKSERKTLSDELRAAARANAPAFIRLVNLGYVVIDENRTTPALRRLAADALALREVMREGALVLYVPGRND